MIERKSNSSKRTERFLEETLLRLLSRKDLEHITVSDISTEANISKATFYKHFFDKYDLAEKAGHSFFADIKKYVLSVRDFPSGRKKEAFASFFNDERFRYQSLLKIHSREYDFLSSFREDIKNYDREVHSSSPLEADLYANSLLWTFDYLLSLNRLISSQDIDVIEKAKLKMAY